MAFFLAGEITQVKDSMPWVHCASGNVSPVCSILHNVFFQCVPLYKLVFLQCVPFCIMVCFPVCSIVHIGFSPVCSILHNGVSPVFHCTHCFSPVCSFFHNGLFSSVFHRTHWFFFSVFHRTHWSANSSDRASAATRDVGFSGDR